jgi:hypothetical protein
MRTCVITSDPLRYLTDKFSVVEVSDASVILTEDGQGAGD